MSRHIVSNNFAFFCSIISGIIQLTERSYIHLLLWRITMTQEIKTIVLSGSEECVTFPGGNCDIRNDSADVVYASCSPNIVPAAVGVMSIPAGTAAKMIGCNGKLYLTGNGSVLCVGNDFKELVFNVAAAAGGSGEDPAARNAIAIHAGNADIHHSTAGIFKAVSNPNLLINPDFRINQRGITTVVGAFAADRWAGTYTDTGHGIAFSKSGEYIVQRIENIDALIGREATATVYYDDGTADTGTTVISTASSYFFTESRTHCLMYQDNGIKGLEIWAAEPCSVVGVKLELGPHSTVFCPPDPAAELVKCKRYYEKITVPADSFIYAFQKKDKCDRAIFALEMSEKSNDHYEVSADAAAARVFLNGSICEIQNLEFTNTSKHRFEVEAILSTPTSQPLSGWVEGITFEVNAAI